MIIPQPLWQYSPGITKFKSVELSADHIVGITGEKTWFCLERSTGRILWQNSQIDRANFAVGLQDDIVVATENVPRKSQNTNIGAYAIDITTQTLLWAAAAPEEQKGIVHWLKRIFTSSTKSYDAAWFVHNKQVYTEKFRILDLHTGEDVGQWEWTDELMRLHLCSMIEFIGEGHLECGSLGTLHLGTPGDTGDSHHEKIEGIYPFYFKAPNDRILWRFSQEQINANGPQQELDWFEIYQPYIYLIIKQIPEESTQANLQMFSLWTLDMRSGQIVQKVPITSEPARALAINAGDNNSLLISYEKANGHSTLLNFARTIVN